MMNSQNNIMNFPNNELETIFVMNIYITKNFNRKSKINYCYKLNLNQKEFCKVQHSFRLIIFNKKMIVIFLI